MNKEYLIILLDVLGAMAFTLIWQKFVREVIFK